MSAVGLQYEIVGFPVLHSLVFMQSVAWYPYYNHFKIAFDYFYELITKIRFHTILLDL